MLIHVYIILKGQWLGEIRCRVLGFWAISDRLLRIDAI